MSGAAGNGFLTYFDQATGTVHSLSATGAAPKALRAQDLTPDELNKGINAGVVPGLFGAWILDARPPRHHEPRRGAGARD